MIALIVVGSIVVWLVGAGVRNEMRPEDSNYRFEHWSTHDFEPLVNFLWPVEVAMFAPTILGMRLGAALRRRPALPEARVVSNDRP